VPGALIGWLGIWAVAVLVLAHPAAAVDAALIKQAPQRTVQPAVMGVAIVVGWILTQLLLRLFVVESFKIPAGSMIPTLEIGDHIFISKLDRSAQRGDMVVFRYPMDPRKDFIKRVVARGGDSIAVRKNTVYVNGQAVPREPIPGLWQYWEYDEGNGKWYKRAARRYREGAPGRTYTTMEDVHGSYRDYPEASLGCGSEGMRPDPNDPDVCLVPPGHIFVLGDNRNNSHDSRFWGPVPLGSVKGKATTIWWSSGSPDGIRWDRIGSSID
jgi:signal peptidase I